MKLLCHYFQAYHSQISKFDDQLSSFALLPIRTQTRGPAPITNTEDIIDETIYYFKANIFFRTYEIKVKPTTSNYSWTEQMIISFLFSEWNRSSAHLYYIVHYGMFEKATKVCEQESSATRIVYVGNQSFWHSRWCRLPIEFGLYEASFIKWCR